MCQLDAYCGVHASFRFLYDLCCYAHVKIKFNHHSALLCSNPGHVTVYKYHIPWREIAGIVNPGLVMSTEALAY